MPYPSTLTSFTDPSPTNRLNSPSHSSVESAQNTGLEELQAFVGTLSSTAGTLIYDIRATASDGGGHVQVANKGGTGQTSYSKGDILIASSSSVLSKLTVGSNDQILVADSTQNTGIKWAAQPTLKIFASVLSSVIGQNTVQESSIFSVTVPSSTLGTNNAVRATIVGNLGFGTASSVLLHATYGGGRVASILLRTGNTTTFPGVLEYRLFGNGTSSVQSGELMARFENMNATTSIIGVPIFDTGVASVISNDPQTIGATLRFSDLSNSNGFTAGGLIIEKIT